jgi:hypothetical protein
LNDAAEAAPAANTVASATSDFSFMNIPIERITTKTPEQVPWVATWSYWTLSVRFM